MNPSENTMQKIEFNKHFNSISKKRIIKTFSATFRYSTLIQCHIVKFGSISNERRINTVKMDKGSVQFFDITIRRSSKKSY